MWFKIAKETLEKLIGRIVSVIPVRTPYPVIQNMLCITENNKLTFLATDLDIYVKTFSEINTKEDARVLLPGKKLADIVRESSSDEIEFIKEESRVVLKAGRSTFRIPILDPDEFPRMFECPSEVKFNMESVELRDLFDAVEFAVSRGEDRPAMTGVLWQINSEYNRMVATDGHRMALSENKENVPQISEQSRILPTKIFTFMPKDYEGPVDVFLDDAKIGLSFEATEVVSRLIEGPYPDYEKVIPKEIDNILTVDRKELSAALKRMMIFSNQVTKQIKLELGKKNLRLYSTSPEGEEAQEELGCTYKGEAFEVAYNGAYLLDILRHID
ncbi:DNA polymerase III subunit beta, partial [candidate division WOR-3 bacterium]|nr:DNA polymerase III subunit beta [candidate division WOR-3 bacterium]MBD3364257.1 DNA polymerase III subunit beta [candidate division WOR-3 bacterium]